MANQGGATFPWSIGDDSKKQHPDASGAHAGSETLHFDTPLDPTHMSKSEIIAAIRAKATAIRDYVPKVGILGDTGVGKSSLCNALFGREIARVGMVEACTRASQEIPIGGDAEGRGGIVLVDMPGIGENQEKTDEYLRDYKQLHQKLDIILWVMKADSRAYENGIRAYDIFKNDLDRCPVVFVLSQADKADPVRDWDTEKNQPGPKQMDYLEKRAADVDRRFGVSLNNIIAISAEEKYNLVALVDLIVKELPREKKFSFVREADSVNVSNIAGITATSGFWDALKDFAGSAWESVKDQMAPLITGLAVAGAKKIAGKIAGWFARFL